MCIHGTRQHHQRRYHHNYFYQPTHKQAATPLEHRLAFQWKKRAHKYNRPDRKSHYQHQRHNIQQWMQQWQLPRWQHLQQQSHDQHCQCQHMAKGNRKSQRVKQKQNTQEQHSPQQQPAEDSKKNNRRQGMRIQAVTFTTKKGDKITTASCEDEQEAEIERMLQEPFVYNNEGRDPKKVQQGMKKEAQSMKRQEVFTEVNYNDVPDEHKSKIIESKWVNKPKQDEVRCRIVAIPGNNSGPRQYLRKHTHLWDSTNPAHNGTAQPLDNPSRRRVNSILTCTSSHRQSVHVATTRAISQRPQHNNSLEAQQSNLRIEVKSKILARQLRTSPTTTWTYTTHKWAQCLQKQGTDNVRDGLRRWPTFPGTTPRKTFQEIHSYDQQAHSESDKQSNSLEETSKTTFNSVSNLSTSQHFWKKQKCKQATRQQLQGRQPWNSPQTTKHPWTNKSMQTTDEQ